jgi:hypothetical protein
MKATDLLKAAGGVLLVLGVAYILTHPSLLFGQEINIGGTDSSNEMKDVRNFATTLQSLFQNVIAKVIGTGCVVMGIYRLSLREFASGGIATVGGGSLFFVDKIVTSLSKMAGG